MLGIVKFAFEKWNNEKINQSAYKNNNSFQIFFIRRYRRVPKSGEKTFY